jgi:hypothetical protein
MNVTWRDIKDMSEDDLSREFAKYKWIMEEEGLIKTKLSNENEKNK